MFERLEDYLERRDAALKYAADNPLDGESWLRIAAEWQNLHDLISRDLGNAAEDGQPAAFKT